MQTQLGESPHCDRQTRRQVARLLARVDLFVRGLEVSGVGRDVDPYQLARLLEASQETRRRLIEIVRDLQAPKRMRMRNAREAAERRRWSGLEGIAGLLTYLGTRAVLEILNGGSDSEGSGRE